jgi:glutathione S-transferase
MGAAFWATAKGGVCGWTAPERAVNFRKLSRKGSDMLKLYFAPGTCALASHIALEEAGAAYTTQRLDFKANQQNSPDYLKVNPKGRVPALVTDRGILTETPAMLAWIAQSFPKAGLAPLDDAYAFAQVQAFNSYARRCMSRMRTRGAAIAGPRKRRPSRT